VSDLDGRVAVVTGATGFLGGAVVGAFLDAGAHVAAPYRSESGAAALRAAFPDAGDRRLTLEAADPGDESAMVRFSESVVRRFGRIDALAALAGGFGGGAVADTGVDTIRALFEQNVVTAYATIRAILPHMRARAYGRIVCVGARPALRGAKNTAGYAIAKTGVVRLVESLADEVKDEGVTVNAVLPSTIDHPVNRERFPKADPRKWVSPSELAAAIVFLCSAEASGITGAAIPVFGRV
jgi:NAD(P)-dependent dehydrogenase (short-subunit alcohol dehydrogenase family)